MCASDFGDGVANPVDSGSTVPDDRRSCGCFCGAYTFFSLSGLKKYKGSLARQKV